MYERDKHAIRCDYCKLKLASGVLSLLDESVVERGTRLRRQLRKKGWRRVKFEGQWVDVCPECWGPPQEEPNGQS